MSNPLKKTMVFLGLAEEELEEMPVEQPKNQAPKEEKSAPVAPVATEAKAPVTPLRRVTPVTKPAAGTMNEILTMHPTQYSDAQTVAENFRAGIPVILNLSRMNENDAKRLIDFSSGLVMGLGGKIERVTSKVFLLSPEHIEVSGPQEQVSHESGSGSFFVTAQ
ncbi:cell division protein SepF [Leucobacter chinensis]|uniref:cell division protein SepF n=1 Tax=Leucobacter chinensis TaxID=2851010 RepID=UPI001C2170BB|nr:cell division protein SepF [Leucobacter chinensis]